MEFNPKRLFFIFIGNRNAKQIIKLYKKITCIHAMQQNDFF